MLSGISNGKGPRGYSRHFLHKKVVCQVFLACQNWSKLYHTQLHEGPIEIPFYNLSVGACFKGSLLWYFLFYVYRETLETARNRYCIIEILTVFLNVIIIFCALMFIIMLNMTG